MHELMIIGVVAVITLLIRALPFLILKDKSNPYIEYLGDVLPYAIMSMLVVYCLKGIHLLTGNHGICEIIGVLSVSLIYLYKRNTLLSIFVGTMIYMICVQIIFV